MSRIHEMLPVLLKDAYKIGHKAQYPQGTTLVYSNFTPRASRVTGVDGVVVFGLQYFIIEYLVNQFGENFFSLERDQAVKAYKRRVDSVLGPGTNVDHIGQLWDLGYLPLHIKALPEGTICPLRVPVFTVRNTKPEFYWLTNMLETLMSNILWKPMTSATTALGYRRVFESFAKITGADRAFIPWQAHDFSFRGMAGIEDACLSAAAHLLSFTGTDTLPALDFLEEYYGANSDTELIGGSVPATEHSVMCMGMEDGELETFRRLVKETYPSGIVSIVSDTWDFWKVLTEYLPKLKDLILARDGKVVIRPDSGDPVDIICGQRSGSFLPRHVEKGAIEVLWDIFGGTTTKEGYKVLDPHIGLIYGDSITPERQKQILERLAAKGFASSNVVLGVGSYTYEYVTRDTYGFAMKATYGERDRGFCTKCSDTGQIGDQVCPTCDGDLRIVGQAIFKAPKTDDGVKSSAKGLLRVCQDLAWPKDPNYVGPISKTLIAQEEVSWEEEAQGALKTIFLDGETPNLTTLKEIRARIEVQL